MSLGENGEEAAVEEAREVRRLLDRLDAHREHPGTLALHDALYTLLCRLERKEGTEQEGTEDARRDLLEVVAAHGAHPVAGAVRSRYLSGDRHSGVETAFPKAPDLESVVASIGDLPLREDPAEALSLYLVQQREIRQLLEERLEDTVQRLDHASRVINLMGGVIVVLLAFAIMGWAGALGWFQVPPPPAVPGAQDASPDREVRAGESEQEARSP